jgi:serine/threonine protein kinase
MPALKNAPAGEHVPLTMADFEEACKYAIRVSDEISSYSKLADNREDIPLLERDEVVLGDLLGSGGFNNVYEVHAVELIEGGPHMKVTSTPSQMTLRKIIEKRGNGELAVKFLNESCKLSSEDYCNGAADLLLETRYLSALSSYPHPHIIRLHAVAAAGPDGFSTGAEGAYFLVLDRLADTLDGRLEVWKELERRKRANLTPEFELQLKALFVKQIQVGVELASALSHLHKLRIIFRDLKPDNVGFDANGVLKLFDFGLAKELDARQKNATGGMYDMSGATGSRRYMAPEVARSEPYHLSADIYSYGVLLWEVFTLEKAFWDMTLEDHHLRVVVGEERPKLSRKWSIMLQTLLQGCMLGAGGKRPPAKQIQKLLAQELESYSKEHNIRIARARRSASMY